MKGFTLANIHNLTIANHLGSQALFFDNLSEIVISFCVCLEHNVFAISKKEFEGGLDCIRIKNSREISFYDTLFRKCFSSKTTASLSVIDDDSILPTGHLLRVSLPNCLYNL